MYTMPRKTTKKPKQKQKQKQVVKQNVKVNVQSSGGGGGSSASPMPAQFHSNPSESIRTTNILSQIAESLKAKAPVVAPVSAPAFSSTPTNDSKTVESVFNAPINTNKPVQLGLDSERPIARKKQKPKMEPPENPFAKESGEESYSSGSEYQAPLNLGFGMPSTAYTKTPYGKVVPKFSEVTSTGETSSSLPSMAMGGGKLEEPVFSGFSVYNR